METSVITRDLIASLNKPVKISFETIETNRFNSIKQKSELLGKSRYLQDIGVLILEDSKEIQVLSDKQLLLKATHKPREYGIFGLSDFTSINLGNMQLHPDTGTLASMFENCYDLKEVDFGSMDTSQVTNMSKMFILCDRLTSVKFNNINTENVTTFESMFRDCTRLKSIDLSMFNTRKATDMQEMFNRCTDLESIDLSTFNTENVVRMHSMFNYCRSLKHIDISNFNMHNVDDMSRMFCVCSSLEDINFGYNVTKVRDAYEVFYNCEKIKAINLRNLKPDDLYSMHMMFENCHSLEYLDLTGLNSTPYCSMDHIFDGCDNLKTIKVSSEEWKQVLDEHLENHSAIDKKPIKCKLVV